MSAIPAPFPLLPSIPSILRPSRGWIPSPIQKIRRGPWWRLPRVRWRDVLPAINNFFALPMSMGGLPLRKDGLPMTDANGCECCGSGSGSGPGPTIDGCGCDPQKAAYQYAITTTGIVNCPTFARFESSIPRLAIKAASGSPNGTTVVTYQGTGSLGCFGSWCIWSAPISLSLIAVACAGSITWDTFSSDGTISLLIDSGLDAWVQITCAGAFDNPAFPGDPGHRRIATGVYFIGQADFTSVRDAHGFPHLTDCHTSHTATNIIPCCMGSDCDAVCDPDPPTGLPPYPCAADWTTVAKAGSAVITPL